MNEWMMLPLNKTKTAVKYRMNILKWLGVQTKSTCLLICNSQTLLLQTIQAVWTKACFLSQSIFSTKFGWESKAMRGYESLFLLIKTVTVYSFLFFKSQ